MKIVFAADHAGFELKEALKSYVQSKGYMTDDVGTFSEDSVDYPDYAQKAAPLVLANEKNYGIFICGTGIGISIAANKQKGIRAALVQSKELAGLARAHNNANVLCLGARFTDEPTAQKIVETFLNTKFEKGRHESRLAKLEG